METENPELACAGCGAPATVLGVLDRVRRCRPAERSLAWACPACAGETWLELEAGGVRLRAGEERLPVRGLRCEWEEDGVRVRMRGRTWYHAARE